ncbi:hypothetical protein [Salinisphaera shabanensis]|uniref:hypothetical protein n=1 Tax=Salinisphaera shabanensis TaxID=180542 RepID=UPI00129A65CA|nr:hypothetical protein [Salinisphaera shabanensis]
MAESDGNNNGEKPAPKVPEPKIPDESRQRRIVTESDERSRRRKFVTDNDKNKR